MILPEETRGVKSDYRDLPVRIRNYRLASLTVSPVKIMDQGPLEHISGLMKEKELIWKSQHEFTKGQSCLNSRIAHYDKMTGFVDKQWMTLTLPLVLLSPFQSTLLPFDLKNKNYI